MVMRTRHSERLARKCHLAAIAAAGGPAMLPGAGGPGPGGDDDGGGGCGDDHPARPAPPGAVPVNLGRRAPRQQKQWINATPFVKHSLCDDVQVTIGRNKVKGRTVHATKLLHPGVIIGDFKSHSCKKTGEFYHNLAENHWLRSYCVSPDNVIHYFPHEWCTDPDRIDHPIWLINCASGELGERPNCRLTNGPDGKIEVTHTIRPGQEILMAYHEQAKNLAKARKAHKREELAIKTAAQVERPGDAYWWCKKCLVWVPQQYSMEQHAKKIPGEAHQPQEPGRRTKLIAIGDSLLDGCELSMLSDGSSEQRRPRYKS